jgi:hypothetical protein
MAHLISLTEIRLAMSDDHGRLKGGEYLVGCGVAPGQDRIANHDMIIASRKDRGDLANSFSPDAADAIANHGVAAGLGYRNGKSRNVLGCKEIAYAYAFARPGISLPMQAFEGASPGEGSVSAQALFAALGSRLNHEALAAFLAATFEHSPTGLSAHALTKTVVVKLLAIRRLECPFHNCSQAAYADGGKPRN